MKKLVALILCLILLCSCASAPVEESSKVEESESASSSETLSEDQKDKLKAMFAETWEDEEEVELVPIELPENYGKEGGLTLGELEEGKSYVGYAELICTMRTPDEKYFQTQGSTFDGEYFYTVLGNNGAEFMIAVSDMEGNVVRYSEPMDIGHGQDMSYVPELNALCIAHCELSEMYSYSLVDMETLEKIKTVEKEYPIGQVDFNINDNTYYTYRGGVIDFWNSDFEHINEVSVPDQGVPYVQGIFTTDQGMWLSCSGGDTGKAEIALIDYEGNLVYQIPIPTAVMCELEDIAYMDDETVYLQSLNMSGYGAQFYKLTFYEQP